MSGNIAKPKELWKTLKSLRLPNKNNYPSNICLKNKNGLSFNSLSIAETFKKSCSSLAENFVSKLPKPSNNFGMQLLNSYYKQCNLKKKVLFAKTELDRVFKILKNFD